MLSTGVALAEPRLGGALEFHRYPGPGPFTARVALLDRLGAAHTLWFTVAWPAGALEASAIADPSARGTLTRA